MGWNVALSMSLYPAIGFLEVVLRNNLHRVVSGHYRTSAWYDIMPTMLTCCGEMDIAKAKAELQKREKPEDPDRLVAQLSLGFWTSLLGTDYEQRLWPRLLIFAFPYMPKRQRTRQHAAHRLHQILKLRNRISHHEPIYRQTNLVQLHDDLQETIGWISPKLLGLLPIGDDFREVYSRDCAAYEI